MEIWYFETSAVNAFLEQRTPEDAAATRRLQRAKGREWRISPVTLWELLMTGDENRRGHIIHLCQHLFSREILPAPGELIIGFIDQGMPRLEKKRELVSDTRIAATWRDLVDDTDRQFAFDHEELKKRVKLLQGFTKDLHRIVRENTNIVHPGEPFTAVDVSLNSLVEALPFVREGEALSPERRLAYKVALHFILFILCAEGDMENESIKAFWSRMGIKKTLARIHFIVHELPTLVHRGPFIVMAYMAIAQLRQGRSRGAWFDSLHSVYLPYVDLVFTSDVHFLGLRDALPEPVIQTKIRHMADVSWTEQPLGAFIGEST